MEQTSGANGSGETSQRRSRDEANWSKPVGRLTVGQTTGGSARNIEGRQVMSPIQGFGKMWQKTYRIEFGRTRVSPSEVVREWKQHFAEFWPSSGSFYAPLTGIAPGEVAALDLSLPGKVKLSTGVLVLYADDESFTLMTPQGHMFAGWITFSAYTREDQTIAQAQVLMRANDPIYEMGLTFGGHRKEDRFWEDTLRSLARYFGTQGEFSKESVVVDAKRQWGRMGNVRDNAAIRSVIYQTGAPFRRKAPAGEV